MRDFLVTLLACSVTMSALALCYMAVTPLLARRYSVTGRYYTWLIMIVGLIIPFRPQFSRTFVKVQMPGNMAVPVIPTNNMAAAFDAAPKVPPHGLPDIFWWQAGAAVWLAGMLVFLVYHAVRHYRFLKMTSRWSEPITEDKTLSRFQNLKAQMGISKEIGLKLCCSIGSPMLIGFAAPCILLPNTEFSEEELCFILKHELVHYKRKDLWYKCLVLIATAVHWFNPIVYLIAKAIDIQCELSCDKGVVSNTGADSRQYYCEAIIGVVRRQSKRKTALSTNFYGGKKGMKERIYSIMDMSKKKTGTAVLCGVLTLTLGTGAAFAANTEYQGPPEMINENIVVSPELSYGFLPDPAIYAKYSSLGITISEDGKMLLYNGRRVRLFMDEESDTEAFFFDEAGQVDLAVTRNGAGNITGIEGISSEKAQEYRNAFIKDEPQKGSMEKTSDITGNKYEEYRAFGVTLSADEKALYYNGQRVKFFADQSSDGLFNTFWTDDAGTVNVLAVRDANGKITAIESISEEKANSYYSAADEYESKVLNGLEERLEEKMKRLYPDN